MRLLLLNLNYLRYHFFIKTMTKILWILNTLPSKKNYRRTLVVYIFCTSPQKHNLCTPYIFSVVLTICLKKTMGLLRIINQPAKGVIGSEQWGIAY